MTAVRNRRTAKLTKSGSNAVGIQKQINRDYSYLLRDYARMGRELFRKPGARFILGGVVLASVTPFLLRFFRNDEVKSFVRGNVESIRSKIDGVIHSGDDALDTLNH